MQDIVIRRITQLDTAERFHIHGDDGVFVHRNPLFQWDLQIDSLAGRYRPNGKYIGSFPDFFHRFTAYRDIQVSTVRDVSGVFDRNQQLILLTQQQLLDAGCQV